MSFVITNKFSTNLKPELHISIPPSFQCFHYYVYKIVMYLTGVTRGKRKNDVRNGFVKKEDPKDDENVVKYEKSS